MWPPWRASRTRSQDSGPTQWTHFYSGGHEYRQLDYILLPESLGNLEPAIMRRGLPYRAGDFDQLPDVGEDNPKASDHCPVYVDIPVERLTA